MLCGMRDLVQARCLEVVDSVRSRHASRRKSDLRQQITFCGEPLLEQTFSGQRTTDFCLPLSASPGVRDTLGDC